jgi:hypothetical protein
VRQALDHALFERVPVGGIVENLEKCAGPQDRVGNPRLGKVFFQRHRGLHVLRVRVEQFGVRHAHEDQVVDARRLGRIDGVAALLKFQVGVGLGGPEVVRDHEQLFCAGLFEGAVQIRAARVIAHHRLHAVPGRHCGQPCRWR